jgi:uncharacterized Zn-binding protein involved in type VI secretion
MGKAAARMGDFVKQDAPHCHAMMHPSAPVPVAVPHPAMMLPIMLGIPTVLIGGLPAATVNSMTGPCLLGGCVPGGPGLVSVGSATVTIGGLPAARVGDMTMHASCVFPLPAPTGTIQQPGCPTVEIGG